jgi:rhodanese-related sulfurtransferase
MGDALVGRIGAVAGIMSRGATVGDLSNLEYPYSPPFSQAMDIVNTLGNVADNMLMGMNQGISPGEFEKLFAGDQNQTCFFLDCREPDNASPFLTRHPGVWHNIPQGSLRERLAEVPRDKTVVLVCNTGSRSYEAQVTLNQAGIKDVLNLHGGMAALKQTGIKL